MRWLLAVALAWFAGVAHADYTPQYYCNLPQCATTGSGASKGVVGATYQDAAAQMIANAKAAWDAAHPTNPLTLGATTYTDRGTNLWDANNASTWMNGTSVIQEPIGVSGAALCGMIGSLTAAIHDGPLAWHCTGTAPANPCSATLAQPMGAQGQEFSVPVSSATGAPSKVCLGGCGYIPRSTGPGAGIVGKLGTQYTYVGMDSSQWIGLGAICTASAVGATGNPTNPPQPYPLPLEPGKCPGTVNGVAVVVPCDTTTSTSVNAGAGAASSASSTASSPAGTTGNTSNKNTETTCTPTTCTTTVTTTVNNPNGTTTTTKDTATEDKGDFCGEHPGSPQCADEEDEQKDPCDDAPDRAGCKNLGTLQPESLLTTTVPLAINRNEGFGPTNGTCPGDQTVTFMGQTITWSWSAFCQFAQGIRPVVIGLAWLAAAISFLGLSRKG